MTPASFCDATGALPTRTTRIFACSSAAVTRSALRPDGPTTKMVVPCSRTTVGSKAGDSSWRPRRPVTKNDAFIMPTPPLIGEGMVTRRLIVRARDVAFLKGIVEAHEGLAAVFAESGGDLTLASPV